MKIENLFEQPQVQLPSRIKSEYGPRLEHINQWIPRLTQYVEKYQASADDINNDPRRRSNPNDRWFLSEFIKQKKQLEKLQAEKAEIEQALASDTHSSQFGDNVSDREDRDVILYAAKQYLERDYSDSDEDFESDVTIKVKQGPRGGIVLNTSGEIKTNFVNGGRGWYTYDTARLPSRVFLFPQKGKLMLYAPETQQKTVLGDVANAVQIIKQFDPLDSSQLQHIEDKGEHEGWTPD